MINKIIIITCLKPHVAEYSCFIYIKIFQKKYKIKFTLISIMGGALEEEFVKLNIPVLILNDLKK